MQKYTVTIYERWSRTYEVEADSPEEAVEQVRNHDVDNLHEFVEEYEPLVTESQ